MSSIKLLDDMQKLYISPLHNYFKRPHITTEDQKIKIFFSGMGSERPWIMRDDGGIKKSFTDEELCRWIEDYGKNMVIRFEKFC